MTDPSRWLTEVLHVVWGFANREHERRVLTPAHAQTALEAVPAYVLYAAGVDPGRAPGAAYTTLYSGPPLADELDMAMRDADRAALDAEQEQ